VVIARSSGSDVQLEPVDLDHPEHPFALGAFKSVSRFDDEPRAHVFGIGQGPVERRWALVTAAAGQGSVCEDDAR
jgi:hypothetical protein